MAPRPAPGPCEPHYFGARVQIAKSREDEEREILAELRKTPPERVKGLLGWKSWSIVYVPSLGGPLLASPYHFALWENPELTAHRSPWEGEGAGIYSWAKEGDFKKDSDVIDCQVSVVGKVEVLGKFLHCKETFDVATKGYRSLRAKVKKLAFNLCPDCGALNQKRWVELFVLSFPLNEDLPLEIIGYCRSCWETDEYLRFTCPENPLVWTAEEMQKILESRYGCPVAPAPSWVIKGQVVGKVGGRYLVVAGESESQS